MIQSPLNVCYVCTDQPPSDWFAATLLLQRMRPVDWPLEPDTEAVLGLLHQGLPSQAEISRRQIGVPGSEQRLSLPRYVDLLSLEGVLLFFQP